VTRKKQLQPRRKIILSQASFNVDIIHHEKIPTKFSFLKIDPKEDLLGGNMTPVIGFEIIMISMLNDSKIRTLTKTHEEIKAMMSQGMKEDSSMVDQVGSCGKKTRRR
jgi:hypothetical protein